MQSWRSTGFAPDDPDSTLVLSFTPADAGGSIALVHVDVPEQDYDGVSEGWEKFYCKPRRRYLEGRAG